ncbi:MAG: DUF1592 domain-containing protein, partial [Deltaproteobacteria bacterium]|nr:DUF1592 domain-containing protein [Nannocystaceae bacterium]
AGDDGPAPVDCEAGAYGPRRLRLLTRREYHQTIVDLLGVEPLALADVPIDPIVEGFDNNADAAVVTDRHVESYMNVAEEVATAAIDGGLSLGCMPEDPACAEDFVASFGRRIFRRPLAADEVAYYAAQFDPSLTEGDFYQGAALALRALLVSPHFLYRFELGEPDDEGRFRLTPHEIATALSYGLWGTLPDDALLDAADTGTLVDAAAIEAQVRRLLDDPRGRAAFDVFGTQWLGTAPLLQVNKDAQVYPAFTPEVREAMAAEQRAFLGHVVFDGEQTMAELLDPGYTFADDVLAAYYGLPAPGSAEPMMVPIDDGRRGGLLRLGSVLASHAHPNESAPIKRGAFVRERLLCQPLAPPPPGVDATPPAIDPNATTRERFSQHSTDPSCSGCHQLIDPLGFGFEHYDGVAGFRETENNLPIDASGAVIDVDGEGTELPYDGLAELSSLLAGRIEAGHCAVEQYQRFAVGRDPIPADECALDELTAMFDDADGNLYEMLVHQYTAPSFVLRQE